MCDLNRLGLRCGALAQRPAWSRLLAGAVLLGALSGCSSLPSSGPTAAQIEQGVSDGTALGIEIVDITAETSPMQVSDASGSASSLALLKGFGTADTIGPGDTLQVTVFEIGTSLFSVQTASLSAADGGGSAPSAAGANLPPIQVDQHGAVTVPYVGRMSVVGMTPGEIQNAIVTHLKGKSQNSQAVVTVQNKIWSTVMVSGDAKQPGRVPLSLRSERLLDAITKAGGAVNPAQDTLVRVTRRGQSGMVWLDDLAAVSTNNILILPQDQIELLHRPRTFTVFGATDKVSEMPFLRPDLSLAEAVARAGGPSDQRADPTAVFLFRYDRTSIDGRPLPHAKPMVYRLDLTRPESYFLAQKFWMRPRDVIYFANAASLQPAKMLQILNLIFQPVYTAKVLAQ